jgi:hypothetical protein
MVAHHIAGADVFIALGVFFVLVSVLRALRGTRRRRRFEQQLIQPRKRGVVKAILRHTATILLWMAIYPLGVTIANKRYVVVKSALRPIEEGLARRNHRIGQFVCVPFLLWPQWFGYCRGCHRLVHYREVPSALHAKVIDLKRVSHGLTERCPAEYSVGAPDDVQPAQADVDSVQQQPAATQPAPPRDLLKVVRSPYRKRSA